MTALVPSETACLASSPGSMRRTAVWISRLLRVAFLLYVASFPASVAKAFENIMDERVHDGHSFLRNSSVGVNLLQHLVNVRRVTLDTLLSLLRFILPIAFFRLVLILDDIGQDTSAGYGHAITQHQFVQFLGRRLPAKGWSATRHPHFFIILILPTQPRVVLVGGKRHNKLLLGVAAELSA